MEKLFIAGVDMLIVMSIKPIYVHHHHILKLCISCVKYEIQIRSMENVYTIGAFLKM